MKTEAVPTELKQVTEIIKQKADPVRIVLFGSRARGYHTASSEYKNWLKRAWSAYDLSRIDKGKNIVYED